ncbi:hypothetical protein GOP47_0017067 [Adiantum capillus-veneris]|uniref:Pentatricopeptide repeat-containing protein n=1 Tax=Adiantum capillus-veneris TaxID=13818 RepID=A0A9D4ZCA1_ADICA|nr:hypothetical protein GOP47_0017067 [Adiantum capillus-veneris]
MNCNVCPRQGPDQEALGCFHQVLEELTIWNGVNREQGQKAVGCFQWMQSEGFYPNAITYACILKACGCTQDADMGLKIHFNIVSQGLLRKIVVLNNALVVTDAKCGARCRLLEHIDCRIRP